MNIVFMGTPDFSVPSLEILIKNNYNVVCVITAPDKAAGRGQLVHESPVKKFAVKNGLKVLQPEKLKDEQFLKELKSLNADLQIVVAFRMLPEAVWNMPKLGTYNLHASLLPKYRGAAPINWAIINGEKETGITTFRLQHEIDSGSVLLTDKVDIHETTTAGELHDTLMFRGAELLLRTVQLIEEFTKDGRDLPFKVQDEKNVSHAPKIFKETCRINWDTDITTVYNFIRGLSPYPGAFTELLNASGKQVLKIFAAEKEQANSDLTNGSLVCDEKKILKIKCRNGFIVVKELQLQGRKRMNTEEFLRGFKVSGASIVA